VASEPFATIGICNARQCDWYAPRFHHCLDRPDHTPSIRRSLDGAREAVQVLKKSEQSCKQGKIEMAFDLKGFTSQACVFDKCFTDYIFPCA
jgi:hypothetical protein